MNDYKFKVYYIDIQDSDEIKSTQKQLDVANAKLIPIKTPKVEKELINKIKDADGLIVVESQINENIINNLEKCKVILRTGVGFDVININAANKKNIAIVNVPDLWTREVANHAMALLLNLNRKISISQRDIQNHLWTPTLPYKVGSLYKETLGIIGLGRIGSETAKRAISFDLNVIAYDPYQNEEYFNKRKVTKVNLEELLIKSDYISLHCPLNKETSHIINKSTLSLMKKSALIINTSRGPVINEKDLIEALNDGEISGAGLDVLEKEPPDENNPLLNMNNAIVSPHSAHYSNESMKTRYIRFGSEVAKVLNGYMPLNLVNKDISNNLKLK
ncbi:MAG: C-terminal binding protein [SAR202 cluster bacterium]|jgi:D-3-phosphoglycerate dehydrogenase|nr:C-terminal binding protein [SAR202 cluster bacterium]|tara:strand:+ start:75 stop:1073 length:999 start_codon:yes stop_codon:yes gene_type:complete